MNSRLGPDLRAMIWKETRENARWAILAMIGIALALVFTVAHQMGGSYANSFGAVWDSAGLVMTFGAPVVGLAIGLLQILPELRRDQWAFLVHRPAPRSTLFWGKALAGAGLTLLATLVPLLCLALWAQAPGNLPAPFDPRLLLGGLAAVLTGLVFHAAGLLTALRPARWYGSRPLPVAAAIVCALLVSAISLEFLQAAVWAGLFLAVLLVAARGSFLTTGTYLRQPRSARSSLGLTLYVGLIATLIAAVSVIGSTITTLFPAPREHRPRTDSYYAISRAGRILSVTSVDGTIVKATDLSGHRVALPRSSNPSAGVYDNFLEEQYLNDTRQTGLSFNTSRRYATLLGTAGRLDTGTIWYYVPARRQVLAYSLDRRRLLGVLGPDGFSTGGTSGFTGPLSATVQNSMNQTLPLLAFPHAVYLLDLYARSVKPILVTPKRISAVDRVDSYFGFNSPNIGMVYVVSAENQFFLFSPAGRSLFTVTREYDRRACPNVNVAMTPDRKRFFLHYFPVRPDLPPLITEISAAGTVVKRTVLPHALNVPNVTNPQSPWPACLFGLLSPPVVTVAANICGGLGRHSTNGFLSDVWRVIKEDTRFWVTACSVSLIGGLFSAVFAWGIGRRCVFMRGGQWAWTVGAFCLGLPGVLLLLSLRDWPARETCPNCGRLRVVDRDRCEHCGAGFPVPARDGTEIFEDGARQPRRLVPSG